MTRGLRPFLAPWLAFASAFTALSSARADERTAPEPPARPKPTAEPDPPSPPRKQAHPDQKRPVLDYDGRGDQTTPGDVLLWVPRVLLVPPYFVTEYLLRRPLGWAIAGAERSGLPAYLYEFFTFGAEHQAGIFPTAFIEFGFYPSVGFYAFWNDAFVEGHDLSFRGGIWNTSWLAGSFTETFQTGSDPTDEFSINAYGLRRPDYTYFGLGPSSRQSSLVRYGRDTLELKTRFHEELWRSSSFRAEVGVRHVNFQRGGLADDPVLDDAIADGTLAAPPGYPEGYTIASAGLIAALDTRRAKPAPGSGVRVAAGGMLSNDFATRSSFLRYGGAIGGFLDVNARSRVLSLTLGARFVDPLAGGEVPFTEQVMLGGDRPMRGFREGRLTDRSAIVADAGYSWPIWMWLNGALHAEVGNVFGEHLDGFRPELLRWTASIGIEDAEDKANKFQVLVGVGSETFEAGGKISSVRVLFGTSYGFED